MLAAGADVLCYTKHMKAKVLRYNVLIRKEGKYFVAYVPTLGISDFGKTIDLAKENVQNAIACHIEGLVKTRTEIPSPDTKDFYLSQAEVPVPKNFRLAF